MDERIEEIKINKFDQNKVNENPDIIYFIKYFIGPNDLDKNGFK